MIYFSFDLGCSMYRVKNLSQTIHKLHGGERTKRHVCKHFCASIIAYFVKEGTRATYGRPHNPILRKLYSLNCVALPDTFQLQIRSTIGTTSVQADSAHWKACSTLMYGQNFIFPITKRKIPSERFYTFEIQYLMLINAISLRNKMSSQIL